MLLSREAGGLEGRRLLKAAEVARLCGIGQRTIWRWVSTGKFPQPDLKNGSRLTRWRADSIAAWIDGQTESAHR
jgi:predicted DNA-binding transcriptional regulator AlpA